MLKIFECTAIIMMHASRNTSESHRLHQQTENNSSEVKKMEEIVHLYTS